jgi:hypothetical protein
MKNLKIGDRVYHYLLMNRIGRITAFEHQPSQDKWMTMGSPAVTVYAVVDFGNNQVEKIPNGDLFKEDV